MDNANKRPMTAAEKKQWNAIRSALGKDADHPLVKMILVDHGHDLPRNPNCILTRQESLELEEWTDHHMKK